MTDTRDVVAEVEKALAKMTPGDYEHMKNNALIAAKDKAVVSHFAVAQALDAVAEIDQLRNWLRALVERVTQAEADYNTAWNKYVLEEAGRRIDVTLLTKERDRLQRRWDGLKAWLLKQDAATTDYHYRQAVSKMTDLEAPDD